MKSLELDYAMYNLAYIVEIAVFAKAKLSKLYKKWPTIARQQQINKLHEIGARLNELQLPFFKFLLSIIPAIQYNVLQYKLCFFFKSFFHKFF